jgi:hypothetical protein
MEVVRLEAAKAAFAAERYYITPEKVSTNVAGRRPTRKENWNA